MGKRHSSEFIHSVRICANNEYTIQETANFLSVTRNSIAGIAHRNKIIFKGKIKDNYSKERVGSFGVSLPLELIARIDKLAPRNRSGFIRDVLEKYFELRYKGWEFF